MMPAIAVLIMLAFVFAVPISAAISNGLFGTPDYFGFVLIAAILLAMVLGGWLAQRSRASLRRR